MIVQHGKVVDGVVVLEPDEALPEGAEVMVIVPETEPFDLTPEEEERLRTSLAQADRGDLISSDEAWARFKKRS